MRTEMMSRHSDVLWIMQFYLQCSSTVWGKDEQGAYCGLVFHNASDRAPRINVCGAACTQYKCDAVAAARDVDIGTCTITFFDMYSEYGQLGAPEPLAVRINAYRAARPALYLPPTELHFTRPPGAVIAMLHLPPTPGKARYPLHVLTIDAMTPRDRAHCSPNANAPA